MNDWSEATVGEFAPLAYGKGLSKVQRTSGSVPVYGSNGQIGSHSDAFVDSAGIIIGRKGSVGEVHYSAVPFWPIDTTFYVTAGPDRDVRYTHYLFQWLDFRRMNSDSAVPGLNRDAAHARVFLKPPVEEQRAIAETLGCIDDKIASNARLAQMFEETARLVLVERGLMEELDDGRSLGDFLDVIETGNRPRGGVSGIAAGVPSIGAESIAGAGLFDYSKVKYVPEEYYEELPRGKLMDRDVLLYKDGGRPGQFEPHVSLIGEGFPFTEAAINEHVYRLRMSEPFGQDLLYFWLRSDLVMEEMRRRGTGVAIPGLNSTNVKELPVPNPMGRQLEQGQAEIKPLMTGVLQLARQSRHLSQLRDSLIPELLSGRQRVTAKATVGGVR